MKTHLPSAWNVLRFSACLFAGLGLAGSGLDAQTVEVVGSASSVGNARIPVINDAGNVFYVNASSYVIGDPTTPIQRTFATVSSILTPGSGNTIPYVFPGNGTVTYPPVAIALASSHYGDNRTR